jgi:hypothetical protein
MATKKKANNGKRNGNNKPKSKPQNGSIAKREDALPAIFGNVEGFPAGMENVDSSDIILPRLALVQSMSRCVNPDDASAPKPGEFINSLSVERYKPPVRLVPIFYNKAAILFPEKINDPIECQSRNAKEGTAFGTCAECENNWADWSRGEPPRCSQIHEFVCVFADDDPESALPFIVSMMRTSAGVGKKWLSAARFAGVNAPLFGVVYELSRDVKENEHGKFYVYTIRPAGRVDDPHAYVPLYQMVSGAYKQDRVVTDFEEAPDRITGDDATDFDPNKL